LETFKNFYVGSGSRIPELYSLSPDWFEYSLVNEIYFGYSYNLNGANKANLKGDDKPLKVTV
jgi:hypothetical protein